MGTEMKMANNRSGLYAGHAFCLHIVRLRPGTTHRGRWAWMIIAGRRKATENA